ncbi:hypothetical protein ACFSKM_18380 [Ancylobacter dichloromethanicus]
MTSGAFSRGWKKRPLSGGGDLRGGRTPFGDIVVDASIAGGVVTLDRLDFSSDRLHVALAGESMIALRTLDLTGLAQLVRAAPAKAGQAGDAQAGTARPGLVASLSGDTGTPAAEVEAADTASAKPTEVTFELPFIVRGDWQRPIVLPDPQALIRRSGAARASWRFGKSSTFPRRRPDGASASGRRVRQAGDG